MAALPERQHSTVAAIYAAWEARADTTPRAYLGASQIGHPCARALWYGFRGATRRPISGRMLRLLDTGQREEARVFDDLRAIGVRVVECQPDGRQWRVEAFGGHVAGHLDAAAQGFEEAPSAWHVVEIKTANTKSFRQVQTQGVRAAKPMHWAQMQTYMRLTEMDRAAYIVVCKETDEIHFERVHADPDEAKRIMERARSIIFAAEPPLRLSDNADYFECRFCDFADACHGTAVPPAGCRSCAHVTPMPDGAWRCERHGTERDFGAQRDGCGEHRIIPVLLERFAEPIDADARGVVYRHRDTKREFVNGPRPGYASAEIAACADKTMLADAGVDALREQFDGTIVE